MDGGEGRRRPRIRALDGGDTAVSPLWVGQPPLLGAEPPLEVPQPPFMGAAIPGEVFTRIREGARIPREVSPPPKEGAQVPAGVFTRIRKGAEIPREVSVPPKEGAEIPGGVAPLQSGSMIDGILERLPRTRAAIEEGIRERLHLGAQIYVSLHGEPVADAALGENRPGEPLTRGHLMLWLSSTKPVPAVAVAQLWERGLLELDDPVALHVPEFAANGKEGITLRHLLTHTAGIRMLDTGWPRGLLGRDHRPDLRHEARAALGARREGRLPPGVELVHPRRGRSSRVGGRPFDRYVREEIFEPLGMADSWIGMPPERYLAYQEAGRIGADVEHRGKRGEAEGARLGHRGALRPSSARAATATAPCASSGASTRCCSAAAAWRAGASCCRRRSRPSPPATGWG